MHLHLPPTRGQDDDSYLQLPLTEATSTHKYEMLVPDIGNIIQARIMG
jgi:hypothetical protein